MNFDFRRSKPEIQPATGNLRRLKFMLDFKPVLGLAGR